MSMSELCYLIGTPLGISLDCYPVQQIQVLILPRLGHTQSTSHDFGIRNGINFYDFGIRNGIKFCNFHNWYWVAYAFSENWHKAGYMFLKDWYKVGYTFWKNWYKERVCF